MSDAFDSPAATGTGGTAPLLAVEDVLHGLPNPAAVRAVSRSRDGGERAARRLVLQQALGGTFAAVAKTHWKTARFDTFEEAVTELRSGITVTITCAANVGRYPTHVLSFIPDGTVVIHDHPAEMDPEGEVVMGALSGHTPACASAGHMFAARLPVPKRWPSRNSLVAVRTLWAAVAWAQHADTDWTPALTQNYLRHGITPGMLTAWESRGWDRDAPTRFMQQGVPDALADQWLAAGRVSLAAAKLAGRGHAPAADDEWLAVGFTHGQSQRWRDHGLTPAEAWAWQQAGGTPKLVRHLQHSLNAARHNGITTSLTDAVVKDWLAAGIKPARLIDWYGATDGTLQTALAWQPVGIRPWDLSRFQRSGQPGYLFTPDEAKAWLDEGVTVWEAARVRDAADRGAHPEHFRQVRQWLIDGDPVMRADALALINQNRARSRQYMREDFRTTPEQDLEQALDGLTNRYNSTLLPVLLDAAVQYARERGIEPAASHHP